MRPVGWTVRQLAKAPAFLDWLLAVAERLLALGLACAAAWLGWRLLFGQLSEAQWSVVTRLADSWKIALLLLVPLFYRTVRTFVEEVREFAGAKRAQRQGVEEPEEPAGRSMKAS